MRASPTAYYVTPHYKDYPCVLARPTALDDAELRELASYRHAPDQYGALGSIALIARNVPRSMADSLAARVNTMVVALRPFLPVRLH